MRASNILDEKNLGKLISGYKQQILDHAKNFSKSKKERLDVLLSCIDDMIDRFNKVEGLELILNLIKSHPPMLDELAFNHFVAKAELHEKKRSFFGSKSLPKVIAAMNDFLLEFVGLNAQWTYYLNSYDAFARKKFDDPALRGLHKLAMNYLLLINDCISSIKPETMTAGNSAHFLVVLREVNAHLQSFIKAASQPFTFSMKEDSLSIPISLCSNHEQSNHDESDLRYALSSFKSKRHQIAKELYPRLENFLSLCKKIRELAENNLLNFWRACETFMNEPTFCHLNDLESQALLELKLTNAYKNRQLIKAYLKEAREVSFAFCHQQLTVAICAKSSNDPIRTAGELCLQSINQAKKSGTSLPFLLDKMTAITNAINEPLIYGFRLEKKTEEVKAAKLRPLGGAMLALLGSILLASSVYLAIQSAGLAVPIALPVSKLGLTLMSVGFATAGVTSGVTSYRFFTKIKNQSRLEASIDVLSGELNHRHDHRKS